MKIAYILAILLVITGCKDAKKSEYTKADRTDTLDVLASDLHPEKKSWKHYVTLAMMLLQQKNLGLVRQWLRLKGVT